VAGFAEMQLARQKPVQAMREAIAVVRRLWRGDTVDYDGEIIALSHGRLDFRPVRPHMPVYIASNGPMGLALAGEVAEGAVMQSPVAPPLVEWFLHQVRRGAQRAGRNPASIDVVARLNLCIDEDARLARDVMRSTIVRTLIAQQPHFRTFVTAGLVLPPRLQDMIMSMGYTHDEALLAPAAALVPDTFVDAITLAGTVEDVTATVVRLAQQGVTHVMIYPIAPDGDVERIIRRFAREVMPRVQERL
jgi:5,10-methylenetetrahydromethanopterin reductase